MNCQRALHLCVVAAAFASCAQRDRASSPPPSSAATEAQCVDAWLHTQHLDEFGQPEGTAYAGGTPLFDEATGKATDRLTYIYANHPDAKAACRPGP